MRSLAALAVLLAAIHMVNAALAESAPPLLLEVWINGRTRHEVSRVESFGGEFYIAAQDLISAGLHLNDSEKKRQIALRGLPGVSFSVDRVNQRLLITAAEDRLPERVFDLRPRSDVPQSTSSRGAALNYDLSGTANDISHIRDGASAGGTFGLNLFAPDMLFSTTGFANAGVRQGGARLDTSLEFDDSSLPRRIVLGDAISGSLSWSRALRFGGIEIASDYSLRPDLITFPLPSFFARASVPETVDVLVGASKVFEENIDPGPFVLHDLPIVTGGGSATIVTTDVLGRESAQTVSLYTTTELLAQGLTDYSVDMGFVRYGYGEQSFDYRTPMASAVYRVGLDGLTMGAHVEATPQIALGGGEAALSLGGFGVLSAAAAYSHGAPGSGELGALNFQGRIGGVNGFASVEATSSHYQDAAGLEDGAPPHVRMQIGASVALPYGSLGVSWIRESNEGASNEALASYAFTAPNGWFVGLTGLRDFNGHSWAAQAFLGIPLDGGIASTSWSGGTSRATALAQFDVPANPDGGFGYTVTAGTDGGQHLEGDATWIAQHAIVDGAVASDGGTIALRGDASGTLLLSGGEIFAARQTDGAFALVQTGAPDVRIYRDNREVAVSDDAGEALLSGLVPYTENRIAIDPRDYPMASIVANTDQTIVPQKSGMVTVDLAPRRLHPVLITVRFPDGAAPPVRTSVMQSSSPASLMVGRDGEIFIPDLSASEDLSLAIGNGSCVIHVDKPSNANADIPRVGPLLCRVGAPA